MTGLELWKSRELGFCCQTTSVNWLKFRSKFDCLTHCYSSKDIRQKVTIEKTSKKRKFTELLDESSYGDYEHDVSEFENSVAVRRLIDENSLDFDQALVCPFEPRASNSVESNLRVLACKKLPSLFKERRLNVGRVNKIFTSRWLSQDHVIFGTKCNNVYVLDVSARGARMPKLVRLPNISTCYTSDFDAKNGGVHALDLNPSGSLMASGSIDPCDVAIHSTPDFRPVALGGGAHSDLIFDLKWIDDEFLVTGSRDSRIALFRFKNQDHFTKSDDYKNNPYKTDMIRSLNDTVIDYGLSSTPCVASRKIKRMEKIRALAYNSFFRTLTATSSNSVVSLIDMRSLRPIRCQKLDPGLSECVCLTHDPWDQRSTAIGSRKRFVFIDSRSLSITSGVPLGPPTEQTTDSHFVQLSDTTGVRSISWQGPLVTVGTGGGQLLFYDVRSCKYLECNSNYDRSLVIGGGWLDRDNEMYREIFINAVSSQAIYTHCYDPSGTKLFAAGGPIAELLVGNYAAVWE